ncbi:MAG: FtsX-like permease family protein [Luteitalea sp.]|nr:FtsX-like permease family protein [Luteitalea sp.]
MHHQSQTMSPMSDLLRDIRFAYRTLSRSPWFAALAVLTLALGIGGTTALFSLLDAVLLRALPYKDADRLVAVWGQNVERTGMRVPIPLVEALRERSTTLDAITINNIDGGAVRTPDGDVEVRGDHVSSNFVDVMGIAPLAGRGFLPEDERPGAIPVMIISYSFWQQRLRGDPEVIGRTLYLEEAPYTGDPLPYTVVGIMPPEFRTYWGSERAYWTPYASEHRRRRERQIGDELIARLAEGVTIDDARREIAAIGASVDIEDWREDGRRLGLSPLKREIVGDSAYALQLLLAAVAVVLAMVCANLAQLLLARSDGRVAEFATRKAIGAPSWQLFRLTLVESLLLSAAGGAAGVGLAYVLLPVMLALAPSEIPRISEAAIDARVLAVAVGLTVLTGCGFGLAPALRLARLSVVEAMKRTPGTRVTSRARFRAALIVGQVAASVTLFALAGLVGRTFLTLLPSDPGFDAESRTVLLVSLLGDRFPDRAERLWRWHDLLRGVEAHPGITGVGLSSRVPFTDNEPIGSVAALDTTGRRGAAAALDADVRVVSSNVFQLLQIPLLQGRIFTSADSSTSPGVAIVNETLARKLAPAGDVLGRTVHIEGGSSAALPAYQIVGVVADARSTGTTVDVWNEIYIPLSQSRAEFAFLIVRSAFDTGTLANALREEVRSVFPELPENPLLLPATSMEDVLMQSVAGPRFSATLVTSFSAMALLLAAIGLFGLVACSVSQRHQELGIRAALGARPWHLVVTVTRSAVVLTAGGVALGLATGGYVTRFVESQLFAIKPLDVPTFVGAALLMLVVAGVAAYLPARHAARTDPMTALRYE